MTTVGIIANGDRDINFSNTKEIVNWLVNRGIKPLFNEQIAKCIGMENSSCESHTIYEKSKFVIVIGGDGTILKVAKNAALTNTPLLGINFGTLGYLTDEEAVNAFVSLEKVLAEEFKIEKRMMLEVSIFEDGILKENNVVLNDVCIAHGVFTNLINLSIYINDEHIDNYKCDGFIVSTPTGSTAYNLSAGGPILKPDAEMISLTPICPHMLHARPIVVSAQDIVKIEFLQSNRGEAIAILDGQNHYKLAPSNTVTIKRSDFYTSIIKTNENSFFDILRHKLITIG